MAGRIVEITIDEINEITFKRSLPSLVSVTSDLIGEDEYITQTRFGISVNRKTPPERMMHFSIKQNIIEVYNSRYFDFAETLKDLYEKILTEEIRIEERYT